MTSGAIAKRASPHVFNSFIFGSGMSRVVHPGNVGIAFLRKGS